MKVKKNQSFKRKTNLKQTWKEKRTKKKLRRRLRRKANKRWRKISATQPNQEAPKK